MKYFYSHIIEIEELVTELDCLDLKPEHRKHLSELVDSMIHHEVLDIILSKLSDEDRKIFYQKMKDDSSNPELMKFLSTKINDIENQIKDVTRKLQRDLHQDVKEAKKHA